MTIMVESIAGRHGAGTVAESLHVETTTMIQTERANWEWGGLLKSQGPPHSDAPLPIRPHLLILPKQFYQLGTKTFKHVSLWVSFSFKPPQP